VTILSIDGKRENVPHRPSSCGSCGMHIEHPREFHPHAACLMFKACQNGTTVTDNLAFVVETVKKWSS
jgi:hypothetical protein